MKKIEIEKIEQSNPCSDYDEVTGKCKASNDLCDGCYIEILNERCGICSYPIYDCHCKEYGGV